MALYQKDPSSLFDTKLQECAVLPILLRSYRQHRAVR